jgi:hypothetical protein
MPTSSLQGGVGVGLVLPPVPDQHERADAHQLPAEQALQGGSGGDEDVHPAREQAQRGKEIGVALVAAHVLDRVHVHEQADRRDDDDHHHRQPVGVEPEGDLDLAVVEPGVGVLDIVADGFTAGPRGRPADPRHRRPRRCDPRGAERADAELGALAGEATTEEQDEPEAGEGKRRDQPEVVEDPVHQWFPLGGQLGPRLIDTRLSPSSSRLV